jgi:hypothetical protein
MNSLPLNDSAKANLSWLQAPEGTLGEPSIAAFVTIPRYNETYNPSLYNGPLHFACAVDARWAPVSLQGLGNVVLGNPQYSLTPPSQTTGGLESTEIWPSQDPSWKRITIGLDWANSLNQPLSDQLNNPTIFQNLVESLGLGFIQCESVETILASIVALGLSDHQPSMTPIRSWPSIRGAHDYSVRIQIEITGYNYQVSNDPKTMCLAIAILLTYCAITITYVIFMLRWYPESSSSWDCLAELITLSVNSSSSELLQGTCAGIEEVKTFSLNVRIVDTSGKEAIDEETQGERTENEEEVGHLELQFSAEKGKWDEDFRPIRNDKAYS